LVLGFINNKNGLEVNGSLLSYPARLTHEPRWNPANGGGQQARVDSNINWLQISVRHLKIESSSYQSGKHDHVAEGNRKKRERCRARAVLHNASRRAVGVATPTTTTTMASSTPATPRC